MKNSYSAGFRPSPAPRAAVLPDFVAQRVTRFYDRLQTSWGGRHIMRGRRADANALLLQSNDYLALTRHADIVDAQCAALRESGNGMMMSGLFVPQDDPLHVVEAELAAALNYETCILTQSGYVANVGLVQSIAGERTPVYTDMLAHASLWEGIKSGGATAVPVLHNDVDHLERQILRHGPGVILVDPTAPTVTSVVPAVAGPASVRNAPHLYRSFFQRRVRCSAQQNVPVLRSLNCWW